MAGFLIEGHGERRYVEELYENMEGWTVIAEGDVKPKDDHDWDDGEKKWKRNKDKEEKRKREGRKNTVSRGELLGMIEALEARVAELEKAK